MMTIYDDRLSRDSQLDDNLKSLVSSHQVSAPIGHLSTVLDTASGEEEVSQLVDEFYKEVRDNSAGGTHQTDNPPIAAFVRHEPMLMFTSDCGKVSCARTADKDSGPSPAPAPL
jgi:hypothetical protein